MRYQIRTERPSQEVLEEAMAHFCSQGVGLEVESQNMLGVVFRGGGYVAITTHPDGEATVIELETREWDFPVRQFMACISRRPSWWQRWKRRKTRPTWTN